MFSMTIVFGASPVPWTLLFRTQESFDRARATFSTATEDGMLQITDDYSQQVIINRGNIQGVMFEDMAVSKLAHIERGLHQMRTQIEGESMGKSDPMISNHMRAARGQQAPGVITPFGANAAFRQ